MREIVVELDRGDNYRFTITRFAPILATITVVSDDTTMWHRIRKGYLVDLAFAKGEYLHMIKGTVLRKRLGRLTVLGTISKSSS
jgi:hypothetical protein